jgi:hypothetical protein
MRRRRFASSASSSYSELLGSCQALRPKISNVPAFFHVCGDENYKKRVERGGRGEEKGIEKEKKGREEERRGRKGRGGTEKGDDNSISRSVALTTI